MKKILSLVLLASLFATSAFALDVGNAVPFSMYSAASGTAVKSTAYDVRRFKTKTVTVQGYDMASPSAAASLSGTALVECGPTSSGPWTTCVDNSYAQTAVSTTANGTRTWTDASAYIRASWAKTAGRVKIWLNWNE